MSLMFPELDSAVVHVSASTRERHLAAVSEAIREERPRRSRFRLMAVAVAVVFLLPVIALAAKDAQPGDFLYPVRQVLPWSEPTPEPAAVIDAPDTAVFEEPDPSAPPPLVEAPDADERDQRQSDREPVEADPEVGERDQTPGDREPDRHDEPRSPPSTGGDEASDTSPDRPKPPDRRGDSSREGSKYDADSIRHRKAQSDGTQEHRKHSLGG